MKYKNHLRAINTDLREFVDNASYLLDSDAGKETIDERITRQYNRLIDPKTTKNQLMEIYKSIASYAVVGCISEMIEAKAQEKHA